MTHQGVSNHPLRRHVESIQMRFGEKGLSLEGLNPPSSWSYNWIQPNSDGLQPTASTDNWIVSWTTSIIWDHFGTQQTKQIERVRTDLLRFRQTRTTVSAQADEAGENRTQKSNINGKNHVYMHAGPRDPIKDLVLFSPEPKKHRFCMWTPLCFMELRVMCIYIYTVYHVFSKLFISLFDCLLKSGKMLTC